MVYLDNSHGFQKCQLCSFTSDQHLETSVRQFSHLHYRFPTPACEKLLCMFALQKNSERWINGRQGMPTATVWLLPLRFCLLNDLVTLYPWLLEWGIKEIYFVLHQCYFWVGSSWCSHHFMIKLLTQILLGGGTFWQPDHDYCIMPYVKPNLMKFDYLLQFIQSVHVMCSMPWRRTTKCLYTQPWNG